MERNFIQGKLEIKLLLLYLLNQINYPIDQSLLVHTAQVDGGVDYFLLADALGDLTARGHVNCQEGLYTITSRGREDLESCLDALPYSVQIRCEQAAASANETLFALYRARTRTEPGTEGGWIAHMTLLDETGQPVLKLELAAAEEKMAATLCRRFERQPDQVLQAIRDVLTDD